MCRIFSVESTEKLAVTNVASVQAVSTNLGVYRLIGDVAFHVKQSAAATTSDSYVPANTEFLMAIPDGETINILGSAAGNVWVSKVAIVNV